VTVGAVTDQIELSEVFRQLVGVNSVELKMTVPSEQRVALRSLRLDPLRGRLREVCFVDTPDLRLFRQGLVVRARRTKDMADDTVVKLRPALPGDLPPALRESRDLKLEMDVTRDGYVISASLKGRPRSGAVREVMLGQRPPERVFTKLQRAFLADRLADPIAWDELVVLGSIVVVVLKWVPDGLQQRLTVEQWHFPGQVPLVELSTKARPDDVIGIYGEVSDFLGRHGLRAAGEQEPKTRRALEFLSRGVGP
jgi:hypothetical protein